MPLSEKEPVNVARLVKDSKSKIEAAAHIELKELLGSGNYGQVYHACLLENCEWAAKISYVTDDLDWETALRDSKFSEALKDLSIYRSSLQPDTMDVGVVPVLNTVEALVKTKTGFVEKTKSLSNKKSKELLFNKTGLVITISELFDGNMSALSERRVKQMPSQFPDLDTSDMRVLGVFYEQELDDMFAIAYAMGSQGFVHADLKPDQFLVDKPNFKKHVWDPAERIAIADFGFSGYVSSQRAKNALPPWMGWTGPDDPKSFPWKTSPRGEMQGLKTIEDAILFNVWQLCMWFYFDRKAFVWVITKTGQLELFGGIIGLTAAIKSWKGGFSGYINASILDVVSRNENRSSPPYFSLSMDNIRQQALGA